jgi:hypothetical protein
MYIDGGGATTGTKVEAEEFRGGEAARGGGEGLRERREGRAGLPDGLKGGDSADSVLTEGEEDTLAAGTGAGLEFELRKGARTTETFKNAPSRLIPSATEVPSTPGTRAFTESHVGVGLPSTERRMSK